LTEKWVGYILRDLKNSSGHSARRSEFYELGEMKQENLIMFPDGIFSCPKSKFYIFWKALEWNILVSWCILHPFGIFCGIFVHLCPFWYDAQRNIWQPWRQLHFV
jgi:hypothetical protein